MLRMRDSARSRPHRRAWLVSPAARPANGHGRGLDICDGSHDSNGGASLRGNEMDTNLVLIPSRPD